jgi:hypothetical protein
MSLSGGKVKKFEAVEKVGDKRVLVFAASL